MSGQLYLNVDDCILTGKELGARVYHCWSIATRGSTVRVYAMPWPTTRHLCLLVGKAHLAARLVPEDDVEIVDEGVTENGQA